MFGDNKILGVKLLVLISHFFQVSGSDSQIGQQKIKSKHFFQNKPYLWLIKIDSV